MPSLHRPGAPVTAAAAQPAGWPAGKTWNHWTEPTLLGRGWRWSQPLTTTCHRSFTFGIRVCVLRSPGWAAASESPSLNLAHSSSPLSAFSKKRSERGEKRPHRQGGPAVGLGLVKLVSGRAFPGAQRDSHTVLLRPWSQAVNPLERSPFYPPLPFLKY